MRGRSAGSDHGKQLKGKRLAWNEEDYGALQAFLGFLFRPVVRAVCFDRLRRPRLGSSRSDAAFRVISDVGCRQPPFPAAKKPDGEWLGRHFPEAETRCSPVTGSSCRGPTPT